MRSARILNGYTVVYDPNHPRAMTNKVWSGYVYEHIKVATELLGRDLRPDEVVHHLDGNRSNNRAANLLVLMRSEHLKLHLWLDSVAGHARSFTDNTSQVPVCSICGATLQGKQESFCSIACRRIHHAATSPKPPREVLAQDVQDGTSLLALGRKYGVSDNAVRKWLVSYGLR